ncbi:MAG: diphosphomevalonate decarboxylase [Candidatus Geothermarchaeales archaeon]
MMVKFLSIAKASFGMTSLRASATAHPIQGLIKYHGKIDDELRLPSHNSISVNVAPITTHTTVEFTEEAEKDILTIDGNRVAGMPQLRASRVLDTLRGLARVDLKATVVSQSDFPADVGLGSSASGFAALTKAGANALNLHLTPARLSAIARVGSGSASRSVVGGFTEWKMATSHWESYGYGLTEEEIPLTMVVALVRKRKDMATTESQWETEGSPFYAARLAQIPRMLMKMKKAIEARDVFEIGRLAEIDTMSMHAATMTGPSGLILWRPETIDVMRKVRQLRKRRTKAYFSVDTGPTVFVNTSDDYADVVRKELRSVETLDGILSCRVGGGAVTVSEHLF